MERPRSIPVSSQEPRSDTRTTDLAEQWGRLREGGRRINDHEEMHTSHTLNAFSPFLSTIPSRLTMIEQDDITVSSPQIHIMFKDERSGISVSGAG